MTCRFVCVCVMCVLFRQIFSSFIAEGAPETVLPDPDSRAQIEFAMSSGQLDDSMFDAVKKTVLASMERDSFRRFLLSEYCDQMVRFPA